MAAPFFFPKFRDICQKLIVPVSRDEAPRHPTDAPHVVRAPRTDCARPNRSRQKHHVVLEHAAEHHGEGGTCAGAGESGQGAAVCVAFIQRQYRDAFKGWWGVTEQRRSRGVGPVAVFGGRGGEKHALSNEKESFFCDGEFGRPAPAVSSQESEMHLLEPMSSQDG